MIPAKRGKDKRGDKAMADTYTILVCDDEKEITDAIEIGRHMMLRRHSLFWRRKRFIC